MKKGRIGENSIKNQKRRIKEWSTNNKDKCNIICQRRRSRKEQLLNTFTIQQWEATKLYFNNSCAYCGKDLPLEQEHFIALTKGGEYTTNNIIACCRSCNSSKSNKDFFSWYPKYKYYNKKRETKILKYLSYKDNVQQLALTL